MILTEDNGHLVSLADKVYNNFLDILNDEDFLKEIGVQNRSTNFIEKMKIKLLDEK